ncbi:hypothetical protein B9479_003437 [Cryptococcus floricola]|uniref:tRNA (guanine(9)-N1)-methyltransferase n=1 Tax=Cryptococcus floricola TaxID=2591691 RepID=A0A5D3AZJ4_9TREE|nr:hypothetical protein B9479_003437 [Cryptococcus floricola]
MDIDEEAAMNVGPSTTPTTAGDKSAAGLSKKAQKRAAKQAKMETLKPLKRAAEKERRRVRNAELHEGYAAGTLSEADKAIVERRRQIERERKEAKKRLDKGEQGDDWKGGVVVDLGFDELMADQEIASTAQQLGYLYSANRTAQHPFRTVIHTTFSPTASPRLWARMSSSNWDKWTRCHWWNEGLDVLQGQLQGSVAQEGQKQETSLGAGGEADGNTMLEKTMLSRLTGPNLPPDLIPGKHTLVYLSADAEEEITTLSEDEVYIIGGIVDRNRYKNLCQDKAEKLGIRTARLPIGSYIANLPTRKVLTVNQVFDILVQYLKFKDWAVAFEAVIPTRKYAATGGRTKRRRARLSKHAGEEGGDAEGGEDDEEGSETDEEPDGEAAGES